jgi:hypothetical protein
VVNIFAREITDDLASLVKQIDETVAKNEDKNMSAFVVLLTDDPDAAEPKLKALAEKQGIKHVPLTIFDGQTGPPNYDISEDADVTVMMWKRTKVQANHAFGKGGLNAAAVKKVVADTSKILE